jgi:ABC-type glycerol-3-phosphate transport system substrate-binding protein
MFWDEVARRFTLANPGIDVQVVASLDQGTYMQTIGSRVIGGNMPDVMIMDDWTTVPLINEKLLHPLDEFVANDSGYRLNEFPAAMAKDGSHGGLRYSVPWYGGFSCIFYRTDLFRRASLQPPTTWKELVEGCHRLQKTAGVANPFGMEATEGFWIMPLIWQQGGEIVSADERIIVIDNPGCIEALQMVHDFMYRDKIMDPSLARGSDLKLYWGSGRIAIMLYGSWIVESLDKEFPDLKGKWDVAPLPSGPRNIGFYGGQHLVMSGSTAHPDLAWRFISFASRPENQRLWTDLTGLPPALQSVFDDPGFKKEHPKLASLRSAITHGRNNSFAPFFEEIWYDRFVNRVLEPAMSNQDSRIPDLVSRGAAEMQAVADQYWDSHGTQERPRP